MKFDDLCFLTYAEHRKLFQDGMHPFYDLVIYMSEEEWVDLIDSLPKAGAMSEIAFEAVQSHGKKIMGCRIYRVIYDYDEKHGVKIYRCGKGREGR